MTQFIDPVMSEPPGPTSQFIEIEDDKGRSLSLGHWLVRMDKRGKRHWRLRVTILELSLLLQRTEQDAIRIRSFDGNAVSSISQEPAPDVDLGEPPGPRRYSSEERDY